MHGTDDRPSNLAASNLESPSITTLSLPMRSGTLNPSVLTEFAISRTCAGIGFAQLSRVRFQGVNGVGHDLKRRKNVVSAEPASFFRFLLTYLRARTPLHFQTFARAARHAILIRHALIRGSPYLARVLFSQGRALIIAEPRALLSSRSLA